MDNDSFLCGVIEGRLAQLASDPRFLLSVSIEVTDRFLR